MKIKTLRQKNKRAISEMVSYVLLIVIAMGLAAGVYTWMKIYVPSDKTAEECKENYAISINDYSCNQSNALLGPIISIEIKNSGLFSLDGFFIKASNQTGRLATIPLTRADAGFMAEPGRYDFPLTERFKPGVELEINFLYKILGESSSVKRIHVQPFIIGKKTGVVLCDNIVDISIEGNNC